jgi:regulator of protease activity HflC (stomatin/prohibitin superfamily)
MNARLTEIARSLRAALASPLAAVRAPSRSKVLTLVALVLGGLALWSLATRPPWVAIEPGAVVVRSNQFTGSTTEFRDGSVFVLPGLHGVRSLTLRDQLYRPEQGRQADGEAPFQSVEGLSLGVDLAIRYAIDPARVAEVARKLPPSIDTEVVQPAVQGVVYRVFSRYTVREIFSSKRGEIQQAIESELKARLGADGLLVRGVQFGKVDLPADYRSGMEHLLAEELASEKMRYTLELKEKQVRQIALEAQADKVRRETAAAAAGAEQVIAAKAQEEAMRHVLPFKHKQIEQRKLEAEASKAARLKIAEGEAQARRIEADGEAAARQTLAEAEAFRQERLGQVASAQMERDGELLTRHPLLIQKTVADKLSDKVQVIIAPTGTDGRFLAAGLTGTLPPPQPARATALKAAP